MERWDLTIGRGETLQQEFRFKEDGVILDLTGYEARCQVRDHPDGGALLAEATVTVTGASGLVTVTIPAETSAGIESGDYAWDLRLEDPDGDVKYYIGGRFRVRPTVTE